MIDTKVYAVIIAAGLSSRMGRYKPLLKIGGVPAVCCLLDRYYLAGVRHFVFVTGFNRSELEITCRTWQRSHEDAEFSFRYNAQYRFTEMMDSARLGFQAVPEVCQRVLFSPVDICLVSTSLIRSLIGARDALIYPSFQYHKGHPVVFSATLLEKLISYCGEGGLKGAFQSTEVQPHYFVTDDAAILMDMDTPEDYEKACRYAGVHPSDC
jgi:molybdenum cofactor cytidylyltransferase